jgi:1,4-alpha-glucan branching enzyme
MPKKSYVKTGRSCKVTFYLPAEVQAKTIAVCGEFNEWAPDALPMKTRKDGVHYASTYLESGRSYRYRFLLDGTRWENDWEAETYLPNEHGSDDSIITI